MNNLKELKKRHKFYSSHADKLRTAIFEITDGTAKSYTINNRLLTVLDVDELYRQLAETEKKIDELATLIAGNRPRRSFAVVPRDF